MLCVLLGNGFVNCNDKGTWLFDSAPYRSAPSFCLTLEQKGEILVKTDEKFLWTPSPIYYDDYRSGERYDARLEREGVYENADMDGFTAPILTKTPTGEVRYGNAYFVRETRRIKPKRILKTSEGYVYDFGENNAGVYELNVNFPAGKTLDMYFGEWLEKGEFYQTNVCPCQVVDERRQRDVYVCNGKPSTYVPSFTFHGFQYVLVKGLEEGEATEDLLSYIVLQGNYETRGAFACSNDTVNALYDCILRSDTSNFFYFPTDCPHREKNGWTGDVALSAEQYLLSFDCAEYLEEYLASVRGATTLAEAFFEFKAKDTMERKDDGIDMPSLNHHFWGMISTFFYRHIAGLDVVSKGQIRVAPDKTTDVEFASASFVDGDARVKVERTFKDGKLHVLIENEGFEGVLSLTNYKVNGLTEVEIPKGKSFYVCEKA